MAEIDYAKGLDTMIRGVAELQRFLPSSEEDRIMASADAMEKSLTDEDLRMLLAIAVDRLAIQKVSDPKGGWPT